MKKKPTAGYVIDLAEPEPETDVDVEMGLVHVKVTAAGDTDVREVFAESYTGSPPANPSEPLAETSPGVYEGDIAAPCSTTSPYTPFRIAGLARFEPDDPMGDPIEAAGDWGRFYGKCV